MTLLKRCVTFAFVLFLAACGGASGPQSAAAPRNPDVITAAELEQFTNMPARQVIERLRPRFLRSRGTTSIGDPTGGQVAVYLGETRMGGPGVLDQIMTGDLREIRYLSASDATQRFGTGHTGGVIVLVPR